MGTNRHTSVAKAAAVLAGDASKEQSVAETIIRNSLITKLIEIRVAKGVSQQQVAERMGCDPSKISRMESGDDYALRWRDIVGYLGALRLNLTMVFDEPDLPVSNRIKDCVFRIHDDLETLAHLAKQGGAEDEIARKIHQFYGEVLFNFLKTFQENAEKLPRFVKVTTAPDDSDSAEEETKARSEEEECINA